MKNKLICGLLLVLVAGCFAPLLKDNWSPRTPNDPGTTTLLVVNETGSHITIRAYPSGTRIGTSIRIEECFNISNMAPSDRGFTFSSVNWFNDHSTPVESISGRNWKITIASWTDNTMVHDMNSLQEWDQCVPND
jgi:hypothetical protein